MRAETEKDYAEKIELNKREKYDRQKMKFEYNINMQDGFNDRVVSPYYELFTETVEEEDLMSDLHILIDLYVSLQGRRTLVTVSTNTQLVPNFPFTKQCTSRNRKL